MKRVKQDKNSKMVIMKIILDLYRYKKSSVLSNKSIESGTG